MFQDSSCCFELSPWFFSQFAFHVLLIVKKSTRLSTFEGTGGTHPHWNFRDVSRFPCQTFQVAFVVIKSGANFIRQQMSFLCWLNEILVKSTDVVRVCLCVCVTSHMCFPFPASLPSRRWCRFQASRPRKMSESSKVVKQVTWHVVPKFKDVSTCCTKHLPVFFTTRGATATVCVTLENVNVSPHNFFDNFTSWGFRNYSIQHTHTHKLKFKTDLVEFQGITFVIRTGEDTVAVKIKKQINKN